MKYCKRCVYPSTKPDLIIDPEGVCSACRAYEARVTTNWREREQMFAKLVEGVKDQKLIYDCIVPVSGGKDSHYQIIKAKEYGLTPLAVTATTDDLSIIGRRNLNNISRLGVDHIEISTNSKIRRRINNYTLREVGDISWPEHVTIFTIPIKEAIIRSIPLIIWGENPQNEYGGPEADTPYMKHSWLQDFGGLCGTRVNDLVHQGIATSEQLHQYRMPIAEAYGRKQSIFLGYYFPWDGYENAQIAKDHGFEVFPGPVEGTGVDYENLDNHQTGIHDYFKYLKFGFGRATDIACNHVRRGRITRGEAVEMVMEFDGRFPNTYLGKPLESILRKIDMEVSEFMEIADRFTNKNIFNPRMGNSPRPRLKHDIKNI